MAHKIIVRTEKGSSNSLREPVQVVFTLTPANSEESTRLYDPVAVGHMTFGVNSDERQAFGWISRLWATKYKARPFNGRNTCSREGSLTEVYSRCRYEITKGDKINYQTSDDTLKFPLIKLVNSAPEPQNFALQTEVDFSSHPLVVYHPLDPGAMATASADLMLQAYVVNGEGSYNRDILTPEHLTRPILDRPLYCKALPELLAWKLCQDTDGSILLNVDDGPKPAAPGSFELVAESVNELRRELADVATSLTATQQRLAVLETTVTTNHFNLSAALAGNHEQISQLGQVVSTIQTTVAELESSVTRTQRRPVTGTTSGFTSHNQRPGWARGLTLAESGDSPHVVLGASGTRDHSSPPANPIDRAPTTPGLATSDFAPNQESSNPLALAAASPGLQDGVPTAQAQAGPDETPGSPQGPPFGKDSLRTLRQQVSGLDRRIPLLESKSDKLARGFGQTRENLASVHKFLQTTHDQVTGLELKVPAMEGKVDHLAESVATTREYLEELESRVTAAEDRGETFTEALNDIRDSLDGIWRGFSPSERPSARLPSEVRDSSHPLVEFSAAEAFPWLSLPQALDSEPDEAH